MMEVTEHLHTPVILTPSEEPPVAVEHLGQAPEWSGR
jgi:hypothetical protein